MICTKRNTAKNTAISPNFLVCKFCGKEHRKLGETAVFFVVEYSLQQKISSIKKKWLQLKGMASLKKNGRKE